MDKEELTTSQPDLKIEGLFGTRWEFIETISGSAVGVGAWRAGNRDDDAPPDVHVGFSSTDTRRLYEWLKGVLGES